MAYIRQKITIVHTRKPAEHNVNLDLQWFCSSLGLVNIRDKDKSCYRVFIELLRSAKQKHALTSDELSTKLSLTRGTVVHHINRLLESGLVVHDGNKYMLRVENLKSLIEEVEKDIKRACDDLKEIAKEVDSKLGL